MWKPPYDSPPYGNMQSIAFTSLYATGLPMLFGENYQNYRNMRNEEPLELNYSCSNVRDKINVVLELKSVPYFHGQESDDAPTRPSFRLVCVIDASHSMSEPYGEDESVTKLEKIKMFVQLLVKTMADTDYLGIVTFGTHAKVVQPLALMTPDAKEAATKAVDAVTVGGVTNLGAGLFMGIDEFKPKLIARKSRYCNDNIILFTDGMANEGIIETPDMIREIRDRINVLRKECNFESDYTVKLCTFGTGGFMPELIYNVGQAFSSDAFYFLDQDTNMELNLMKPVILRQTAVASNVKVRVSTFNGVRLKKAEMRNDFEPLKIPLDEEEEEVEDNSCIEYYIHDIAADMQRHFVCLLQLPSKKKRALKKKDVVKIEVVYRDEFMKEHTIEKCIPYVEIPRKEHKTSESDTIVGAEHECRIITQNCLDQAADCMKKLARAGAKTSIQSGANEIRELCEYISTKISEEAYADLLAFIDRYLANLEQCDKFLGDFTVKWDDAWGRLMALSSSLGRETPTASGVYVEGTEMFISRPLEAKLDDLYNRLVEIYRARGMSIEAIGRFKCVMRELQDKIDEVHDDLEQQFRGQEEYDLQRKLRDLSETPV